VATRSRRLEPRRPPYHGYGNARRPARLPSRALGAEARDRIVEAAVRLFAENGYGATSVRDIASAARVRLATLNHHFQSKEEIYTEVHRRRERAVHELVASCMSTNLGLRDLVRLITEKLFDFFLEHRDEARLAFEARFERMQGWKPPDTGFWWALTEEMMPAAEAAELARDVDLALFVLSIEGLLHWHVINQSAYRMNVGNDLKDTATAARAKHHITQFVLRGLGIE